MVAVNLACLWDTDTLAMERQQFPTIYELLTGKFVRHSDAYYRWRIADRTSKLDAAEMAQYYDDIAVAYDKIGKGDSALLWMQKKAQKWPNTYETQANLATFYFHQQNWTKGLQHINAALKINPNAHFGREEVQKWLVEYLQSAFPSGTISFPLRRNALQANFCEYLFKRFPQKDKDSLVRKTVKGLAGMMQFGNHTSPVLNQAMGDMLLFSYEDPASARALAIRAYLKAFKYANTGLSFEQAFSEFESTTLIQYEGREVHWREIAEAFDNECREGDVYFQEIKANEEKWISEGLDVDEAFAKEYYNGNTKKSVEAVALGGAENDVNNVALLAAAQNQDASQDTVLLKEETRSKKQLNLKRETRGLAENRDVYGKLVLISLVVVAVIAVLVFKNKKRF